MTDNFSATRIVDQLASQIKMSKAIRKQRLSQRELMESPDQRLHARDAIFDALDPMIRLALLPSSFQWAFCDQFGGMLVVGYHMEPLITRNLQHLAAFLEAVRDATGIHHVVIAGGIHPVVCHWNQEWVVRFGDGRPT